VNNTVHDTKPQVRRPQDRRAKDKQGQVAQAGVFGAPVLTVGPAAVAQFQVGELTAVGVGGEAGDAVPVDIGES
jgi:hypothetical protein